jgi:maltose 6'-phosphate phosphatase
MQPPKSLKFLKGLALFIVFAALLSATTPCYGDGVLRVMTVNLLFSEITDRNERLNRIADYVADSETDVILLQEVVGGALAGISNSAAVLRQKIFRRTGLWYDISYRLANGVPGFLSVGLATLTRGKILLTLSRTLPFVSEEIFEGIVVPLRRKVMMSRIRIPGYGKLNVYNTHLCAFCDPEDRLRQAEVLFDFMETVESLFWRENVILLGGDFNTPNDSDVYSLITGSGFRDTYEEANGGCGSCCTLGSDPSCTYAAYGNPYAVNLFTGEREEPARIDYIFLRNPTGRVLIEGSTVVFKTDPKWVSDHSAVVTDFTLASP